jgi:hypothetical protein
MSDLPEALNLEWLQQWSKAKTLTRCSVEIRTRSVRLVLEHANDHASQSRAIGLIAAQIGCAPETLRGCLGVSGVLWPLWL